MGIKDTFNSVIVTICFALWIIPLGAFIKLSQEEQVCNGRRAICLCSIHFAKHKTSGGQKFIITNPDANKEAQSGGAGYDFLAFDV